jgi:F-type H+-transporting ATPase subunit gamma
LKPCCRSVSLKWNRCAEADESATASRANYEFLPSAESILEEVVPASFRVKLFKCFLDAAVSEQIARMVAMKSATENAGEIIKQLSMTFNRARQAKITGKKSWKSSVASKP